MRTNKEMKLMIDNKTISRKMIVNAILNYDDKIKQIKQKIKEYQELLEEGTLVEKNFLENYEDKLEEFKFKRNVILESFSPCEIVKAKEKYYLKYYIRFSFLEDYIFYSYLNDKNIYLYPKLKIKKRLLKRKKYNYERYTTHFLNKIYDLINNGRYEIID